MFGSEEEYKIPLTNSLRVAIVSHNIQNIELATKIQEKVLIGYKKKLQFTHVDNINDLFKFREVNKEENTNGLIDKRWISNVINFIPSVIILNFQIQSIESKESDEKTIYQFSEEIKKYTKNCAIFLIIICKDYQENQNQYNFNFDDKLKPYYLKNYINKDNFYIFQDEQIWKYNEFIDICNKILSSGRQFYRVNKKSFKERRTQSKSREEKIEYDIKLGIISVIKTQKENMNESKYLEEAYELLCDKNFDLNMYLYGAKPVNIKNNLYELRAVADWLFFKTNNLKITRRNSISFKNNKAKTIPVSNRANSIYSKINIEEQIKKCERHISCFGNYKYYDKGEKDYFHFVEYFWRIQRYTSVSDFIEENFSSIKFNKKKLIKYGNILFKEAYNIIRIIKFYKKYFNDPNFDISSFENNGKKYKISEIEEEQNNFFGKPPSYYIIDKENSDNKINLGFNDEIYIKKFLSEYEINLEDTITNFRNKYLNQLSSFISKLKEINKNSKNDMGGWGLDMYLNILKIIGLCENIDDENIYDIVYVGEVYSKIIYGYEMIKKFPLVYMDYVKQYINYIQYKIKKDNNNSSQNAYKMELFINLATLGNLRKLNSDEEKLFYQLLDDSEFNPKSIEKEKDKDKENKNIIKINYYDKKNISIINYDDLAFSFDYSIKDIEKYQERKILDLVDYEIKFNSSLSQEKLKFNSIKLFFQYSNDNKDKDKNKKNKNIINSETIIKEFNKDELNQYELGLNSPVTIIYRLLLKYRIGKISLNKVLFSFAKKENIFYSIDIPNELNKTIFLSGKENKVLNLQCPKKTIIAGVDQLFKFKYTVNKEKIDKIKIKDYKQEFIGDPMDNNLLSQLYDEYIESKSGSKTNKRSKVSGSQHISKNKNNKIDNNSIIDFIFLRNSHSRNMSFDTQDLGQSPPIFFFFDEKEEYMVESKNRFELTYNDFESRLNEGKNTYEALIKFSKNGLYMIKLNLKYVIQHDEIDVNLEFNQEEVFYFKVMEPLSLTYNLSSNNYMIYNSKESSKNKHKESKEYLTDTNINMNLIFNNLIDEDIIIKDMMIQLNQQENIEFHSTVKDIIDSTDLEEEIKEQILSILQSSNYVIPYNLNFKELFNGTLGKIKLTWTTKSLKEYEKKVKKDFNFFNNTEFDLPKIDVNAIKIKIKYEYVINDNKEVILKVHINNMSDYNKRLVITVENNSGDNSYIISGVVKYHINLKIGETKKIISKIVILQIGELKLPDIVVRELDITGNEKYTNYFCSDKILLQ